MRNISRGIRAYWFEYKKDKMAVVGLGALLLASFLAVFAPYLSPYDPWYLSDDMFASPSWKHLMGTDQLGRDTFSRVIWGTRVSLLFAIGAAVISMAVGTTLGAIAGYYGGILDDFLSRIFEIFIMLPILFLIILIISVFGANLAYTMIILGITIWPSNARVMRGQVLSLKSRAFVKAITGIGASDFHILFRHIIPNCMYPVVANSTLQMAWAVIVEASLSFLGLGDINQVSWGGMLKEAQGTLRVAWWMALFPGVAILMLVLGLNLFGDRINYVLNPRLRQRQS